jgi:hypothetical protein
LAFLFGIIYLIIMSIFPRKLHGPELKCGGPSLCQDCQERLRQAQTYGIGILFIDWLKSELDKNQEKILKISQNLNNRL